MKMFSIYDRIDELDISKLKEHVKVTSWPKGKRYTVNCNGVEIKIQTFYASAAVPENGYNAYDAISSMYSRELEEDEIFWEHEGTQYEDPQFDLRKLTSLNSEQIQRRTDFILSIVNLINNQETMEAIVQAATKKKNGTLYKNRVVRIASSGIADSYKYIFALVAKAKTDNTMSITFGDVLCKPGDNELWENDFISAYHEGLPVSEAIKDILGDK